MSLVWPRMRDDRGKDRGPVARSELTALCKRESKWAARVARRYRDRDLRRRGWLVACVLVAAAVVIGYGIKVDVPGGDDPASTTLIAIGLAMVLACWPAHSRRMLQAQIRAARQERVCAWCVYDLSGLRPDPEDGCTLCPECGAAWRMGEEATKRRSDAATERGE